MENPTKKEIETAISLLEKANIPVNKYFNCRCPKEIANGYDGLVHLCPIDCVQTKKSIINACRVRIKVLNRRLKEVKKLYGKIAKQRE
jgi:hypothetical protein